MPTQNWFTFCFHFHSLFGALTIVAKGRLCPNLEISENFKLHLNLETDSTNRILSKIHLRLCWLEDAPFGTKKEMTPSIYSSLKSIRMQQLCKKQVKISVQSFLKSTQNEPKVQAKTNSIFRLRPPTCKFLKSQLEFAKVEI